MKEVFYAISVLSLASVLVGGASIFVLGLPLLKGGAISPDQDRFRQRLASLKRVLCVMGGILAVEFFAALLYCRCP
ncbi:MAG: hypothetical protein BWY68_00690 [bacterium ADurb.Bin400]|nr:MAG: hypothetical protein BWY68_00690 [bacterium ADurb.Bin400]